MLDSSKAFSSCSIDDVQKAKQFYGETLGLKAKETPEGLRLELGGGGTVFLYPKPNHEPATFTVLNFPVSKIDDVVAGLKTRGVTFESYDLPGLKTGADNIARSDGKPCDGPSAIAWFKDPAGNIISVLEE
jgi:catechol 2,3-dioxygenase-like lactoylglutathione lyase family enzyme